MKNEPKKPLTMEDSWSKICTRWAHSLELSPVRELTHLSDGKFFAAFMSKYLPWNSSSNTPAETFQHLEAGLMNEFPFGSVVRMAEAQAGHEEELVKVVTLLMYLAAVKHLNPSLSATLQDSRLFSKEVQLRFKCILQALMEQHSMLTPSLLGEIIMSKISETTGQLTAPVVRVGKPMRVGKPSPGSPVIFSSSPGGGSGSPLKDFLDSPQTRQVATYQKMVEERNVQTRMLRTELENEKTERQFLFEEANRLKEDKKKLESEMNTVKQELRDRNVATETPDSSLNEGDLSQKYHQLMTEKKEQAKYLATVEQQLYEVEEDKSRLESRLQGVMEKLSSATDDKHRVEMTMDDMRLNLTEARSENSKMSENVEELQGQIEDLTQQLQLSFLSGGRKSLAPSMTSFHFNACDMTNVSLDADDSVGGGMVTSFGENMGDVVGQQLEEKIDNLEMEKGQLEGEVEMEREIRERTQVELQKEKDIKVEMATRVVVVEKELNEEKESRLAIEVDLDKERVEKGIVVMEVNKLRSNIEKLEAKNDEDSRVSAETINELSERFNKEMEKCQNLERDVADSTEKTEQVETELKSLREVRLRIGVELTAEKEKCLNYEKQLNEENTRKVQILAELEIGEKNLNELNTKLEAELEKFSEVSRQLQDERESSDKMKKEVEEARVIFEERQITLLADKNKLGSDLEIIGKEKDNLALELAQKEDALAKVETLYNVEVLKCEEVSQQLVSHRATIQELEESKLEMEEKFNKSEREVASADERLEALQKKQYEFLDKIDILDSEKKTLTTEKGLLDAKIPGYEEHIKNLDAKIVEKEATIENLTDHMETQRTNHLNKDAELTSANDKIADLEKKLINKTQEAVSAQSGHDNKSKEAVALQAAIDDKSQQLLCLQTAFDQKCLEVQEKEQEMESRIDQLGAAGEEMGKLKAELAELKDDIESKVAEIEKLRSKLEKKESENNEVVSKTTELAVTIENFSDKIQTLEQELTENVKDSEEKKQEFVTKISELECKLVESEESKTSLNEQIAALSSEAESLGIENKKENEILNENLTAYATQLKEVREQESKLEEELRIIKLELEIKITGCEEHSRLTEELQTLLKNKETENAELFKFVKEKDVAIQDFNGQVKTLTSEKDNYETQLFDIKADFEKEVVLKGVKEEELSKLQFLLEESKTKLSGDEKELVLMKEKSIEIEKEVELLKVDKDNLTKANDNYFDRITNLEADKNDLQIELDKVAEENKSMEEVLEGIEQKRQELELEKQKLNETLGEVGANCDKRGEEIRQHLDKIKDLQMKLENLEKEKGENYDELTHKVEFLQSQMEEMDNEKDQMKIHLEEMKKEKCLLEKDKESIKETLSNVTEKQLKEIETEKLEMKSKIEEVENLLEERNQEGVKMHEDMEKLQKTKKDLLDEKNEMRKEVEEILEEKNKLSEKSKDVETKLLIQKDKLAEYEVSVTSLTNEIETCKTEKCEIEKKIQEVGELKEKFESRNKKLEEELKATKDSRESLASSVSQLITDTNELKEKVEFNKMEHEKEKLKFDRESQELKMSIEEKEQTLAELQKEMQAKAAFESDLEVRNKEVEEHKSSINNLQSEIEKLKHELASAEIKYTDLEQATEEQGVTEIKEALKAQKERYEANHKKIVDGQTEKYKAKLQEFAKITEQQLDKKIEEVKKIEEEKRTLTAKCESYKSKVTDMVEKMGENEKLNTEEVEVLHSKYSRSKEEIVKIQKKYEAAKSLIQKLTEEKQNLLAELDMKLREAKESDSEILKRELVLVKTENRTLTNQLSYADTKLREVNKFVDVRPTNRSRENSLSSHNSERSSLDFRSRESISSIVRGDNIPRTSSRQSLSRESTQSRDSSTRDSLSSNARARPSVPGRADRQSRQSTSTLDDSVFKLPGPNTPGRAKSGRTVSDSRMAASRYGYRPPAGSGSLFNCDEEAGEMFSNSYLTDLKEGLCDLTDSSSRMSELARRNTLCLPHLKSAYPVESQFCEDEDVTEEAIRQSRIGRLTDFPARGLADVNSPAPSPVTRLSQAASNLSLESPASSTRSRKSLSQGSEHSDTNRPKLPPPTTFTIEPPKPGTAVRKASRSTVKLGTARTVSMSSKTSSTGSLTRERPARPPRPVKQACTSEHSRPALEELENLPVDDPVSRYLSEGDQSVNTPGSGKKGRKRKSQKGVVYSEPAEDLDCSQDSISSSFSRSSLRTSKRLKGGNVSYNKPGPPTPGRKSLGNLSLPRTNTSLTSLETTTSYPGVSTNTPDMSRVSTRSAVSLKTPLLDTTNTPNKSKNQSKLSKMTPLGLRKVIGSAFRTKKYKLMKKQDNTINRDQSIKTTPLKAKDRAVSSPRKKLK